MQTRASSYNNALMRRLQGNSLNAGEAKPLPFNGLQVKTYYFDYPPVEALLDMLGSSLKAQLVGFKGGERIGEILRRAGLEYLDDFGTSSPRSLHVYEGIPLGAVCLLYSGAVEMIRGVHLELEEEIRDIEEAVEK